MRIAMLCSLLFVTCAVIATGPDAQQLIVAADKDWFDVVKDALLSKNSVWVAVCFLIGVFLTMAATETLKNLDEAFPTLFGGEGEVFQKKMKIWALLVGTILTSTMIWLTTDYPTINKAVFAPVMGFLSGFYSPKIYDKLCEYFPVLMDKTIRKLSPKNPPDGTP